MKPYNKDLCFDDIEIKATDQEKRKEIESIILADMLPRSFRGEKTTTYKR